MKYFGIVLLVLSGSTTALADIDTYLALNVGASIVDDVHQEASILSLDSETLTTNFDFGHTISVALGVSLSDGYRFEVEAANQINDLVGRSPTTWCCWINGVTTNPFIRSSAKYEGIHVAVSTLLANAYKDFYIVDKFLGYVSGGIGVAYNEMDQRSYVEDGEGRSPVHINNGEKNAETVLAWQLGAGLGYELTKEIILNAGYRYLVTDKADDTQHSIYQYYEVGSHNVTAGIRYSF